jgi:hypothetical protein
MSSDGIRTFERLDEEIRSEQLRRKTYKYYVFKFYNLRHPEQLLDYRPARIRRPERVKTTRRFKY